LNNAQNKKSLNQSIEQPSSTSLTVIEGEDLEIFCNAHGKPPPKITWFLVETKLKKSIFLIGYFITFSL
jgi:hypothetical protein